MKISKFRTSGFQEMMDYITGLIEEANIVAPEAESKAELIERLKRTLDQGPNLYTYLQEATSYLSYWTDMASNMRGTGSDAYKDLRNKRDAADRMAKAVKLRYESASRRITLLEMEEEYEHRR